MSLPFQFKHWTILTTAALIVNTLAILSQQGNTLVQQLKEAIAPRSATGKSAASLQFTVHREGTKDILEITGKPFIMAIETGRKPTPQYNKPSVQFVASIKEWLQAKGGDTNLAYAIAKSIHQKGTKGTPGIISGPIDLMVALIQKDILDQFAKQWMFNVVQFVSDNRN